MLKLRLFMRAVPLPSGQDEAEVYDGSHTIYSRSIPPMAEDRQLTGFSEEWVIPALTYGD